MEHKKQINKVIDHITQNLGKQISIKELADVAGLSSYHFHRVFREETGETIGGYILRKRMEKAVRELRRNTNTPISEIAYDVGYGSAAAFCRNFKKHYGMTASEYRQQESKNNQSEDNNEEFISTYTRYISIR